MTYDDLLTKADSEGLVVKEKPLKYNDGRQKGRRIAIRKNINTSTQKGCVLAEELGHYHTTVGNILNQQEVQNRKQELHARMWAYNHLIGLYGIISCYRVGCQNLYEMAEHLEVTEAFLKEALDSYKSKYGKCVKFDNYVIYFDPYICVAEII